MVREIAPRRRYQGKGHLSTLLSVGHPAFRSTPCFQVDANISGHQGGRLKMVPLCREVSENIHGSPASTVRQKSEMTLSSRNKLWSSKPRRRGSRSRCEDHRRELSGGD